MYDLERFGELLRRHFVPVVCAQGFEPSGSVFRRARGDRIDIVSLQSSRGRRQCCVNLGVHYAFLPPAGRPAGVQALDGHFSHHDCTFRARLHEPGESDHWWSYGTDDATAEASAAGLVDTYRRCAELFFEQFEPSPDTAGARARTPSASQPSTSEG
jgi:hypothetical protein